MFDTPTYREFRQNNGRSGIRYWTIFLEFEQIHTSWGSFDDGLYSQYGETDDIPGPKGKPNTKAFKTAEENAQFCYDRLIRKKKEEGYVEVNIETGEPLEPVDETANVILWDRPLPKNLCFCKPKNSVSESHVQKLYSRSDLILTRKINGLTVVAQIGDKRKIRLFSRRMDSVTDHFPQLVEALDWMNVSFLDQTVLLFEGYFGEGNTQEEFEAVQGVMNSKPERALELQQRDGWIKFYLYRVPILNGIEIEKTHSCRDQIETIETFSHGFETFCFHRRKYGRFLETVRCIDIDPEDIKQTILERGWEGFVGYQASGTFGDYSYSFHGKPDRPSCSFKIKPEFEDDFVVFWEPDKSTKEFPRGTWGSGKNSKSIGAVSLYQYNTKGELVYICDTSAFTDEKRARLESITSWPICARVKYTNRSFISRGRKTNALLFPRFDEMRTDKTVEECVREEL